MSLNIQKHIDKLKNLQNEKYVIPEKELRKIVNKAKEILMEESNIHPVTAPVNICGDIHGQFYDVLNLFKKAGEIPKNKYVFMGDYVDRGSQSVETIQYLICLKVLYPDKLTLVRGNHESRRANKDYGFYDEVHKKYGNAVPWLMINDFFDYLPISALVEGEVLCIHGGLSPEIKTIDQINTIHRFTEIPNDGPFTDMLWSDPDAGVDLWAINVERGAGYVFGSKVAEKFCELNNLKMICRGHQLVMEGFQYPFKNELLATIWSAPNYCYRCANQAVVLKIDENLNKEIVYFEENENENVKLQNTNVLPYFL